MHGVKEVDKSPTNETLLFCLELGDNGCYSNGERGAGNGERGAGNRERGTITRNEMKH